MKKILSLVFILLVSVVFADIAVGPNYNWQDLEDDPTLFASRSATEAWLSFRGRIEIPLRKFSSSAQHLLKTEDGRENFLKRASDKRDGLHEDVADLIQEQVRHLISTFHTDEFFCESKGHGIIGEIQSLESVDSVELRKRSTVSLEYQYQAKAVFSKKAFRRKKKVKVPAWMPLNPFTVYEETVVGQKNPCSDEHYNSEGDFCYFWNPFNSGCSLAKGEAKENLVYWFEATLEKIPNTLLSYPEYDLVYGDNKNGNLTQIGVYVGFSDSPATESEARADQGMPAFEDLTHWLEGKIGMKTMTSLDGFRMTMRGVQREGVSFYRVYEKEVEGKLLRVNLLLADTAIDSPDQTFHYYLMKGLVEDDIFYYAGHSGLGGNLHLTYLGNTYGQVRFKKDKYQLFYFEGCSTYPYYNGMYFKAKGGSKYLDVITTGVSSYFSDNGNVFKAFLEPFLYLDEKSYQDLMENVDHAIDAYWLREKTYLTGVNGDEDNEYRPSR